MKEILEKLDLLEDKIELMNKKLDKLEEISNKMDKHREFVEGVYEKIKSPFHYVMSKAEQVLKK